MMKIAPSLLSADFARLGPEVRKVTLAGADLIHFDVMDGHFVPNITFGPMILSAIRTYSRLPFEAHLMISEPEKYWKRFADAGAQVIGIHIESELDHGRLLKEIRRYGKSPCMVINPPTDVERITRFLPLVDQVLVMTVNPGFGGQSFIPETLGKIRFLAGRRRRYRSRFTIEVDGGINFATAATVKEAGADILVAGSFIFGSRSYSSTIRGLRCAR
jgi:ribulose-phosphate 3-epimerase